MKLGEAGKFSKRLQAATHGALRLSQPVQHFFRRIARPTLCLQLRDLVELRNDALLNYSNPTKQRSGAGVRAFLLDCIAFQI